MGNEQGRSIPVVTIDLDSGYTQRFDNDDELIPGVGDTIVRLKFDRVTEAARVIVTERMLVYSEDDKLLSITLKVRDAR